MIYHLVLFLAVYCSCYYPLGLYSNLFLIANKPWRQSAAACLQTHQLIPLMFCLHLQSNCTTDLLFCTKTGSRRETTTRIDTLKSPCCFTDIVQRLINEGRQTAHTNAWKYVDRSYTEGRKNCTTPDMAHVQNTFVNVSLLDKNKDERNRFICRSPQRKMFQGLRVFFIQVTFYRAVTVYLTAELTKITKFSSDESIITTLA